MSEDELMFNLDTDLEANDTVEPGTSTHRHSIRRSRFPPRQVGLEAYTGEIDHSIEDTHLQHDLKRHPSTQAQKAQYSPLSFPFVDRRGLRFPSVCSMHPLMRIIAHS